MEKREELQWIKAQQIIVNVNLVNAAKQQLQFLAAVDKNRCLYEGPTLTYAVSRYKYCWLPLLAKQAELGVYPLVAPLDCEWVWHCHRLNPLRYKADCEELYGRVLDSSNVVSSIDGGSTTQTEEIWKTLYPNEPYLIDLNINYEEDDHAIASKFNDSNTTSYDLISAVKRQSTFFYQVSRPHMSNEEYLKESVSRYKAFLHLIRMNMKSNLTNKFCVPTYDIDLIWHSHQLHPAAYCQDTIAVFGKVLDHDDTDSDRGQGTKLNLGFADTTKQWEETFGFSYGRAGARYRGPQPLPLMLDSFMSTIASNKINKGSENIVKLPKQFVVQVLMEIVGVRIVPKNPGEKLFICLSKKDDIKQTIRIPFDPEVKEVVAFQCEPNGVLNFELVSSLQNPEATEILGTGSLSLPEGRLSEVLVLELVPSSGVASENPMTLHVSLSLTPPSPAPYMLYIAKPQKKIELNNGNWMCVVDKSGNFVVGIQVKGNNKKEMIGVSETGETKILAESHGSGWSFLDSGWSLHPSKKTSDQGKLYELIGERKVAIVPGRKLEYETQPLRKRANEEGYMTAVEFSTEDPNGRAIGLFDLHSCALEIKEEWFLLPGIISACVLSSSMEDDFMARCSGSCSGSCGGYGGGGSCSGSCSGGCHGGGCRSECTGTCGS